jgi:hypothetical protein
MPPPRSRSLCPLSSTEFVDTPSLPPKKFLGTPLLTSTLLEEEELRRLKRFKTTQPDFRKYHFTDM